MRPLYPPLVQVLLLDPAATTVLRRFITASPDERDEIVIALVDPHGQRHRLTPRFVSRPYW
ncbi:MAG TPA: hypothetical protein VM687_02340 [Stenotrophomonas sp.]|nr:hypothetical protein [Stenotrophomonas sp.]